MHTSTKFIFAATVTLATVGQARAAASQLVITDNTATTVTMAEDAAALKVGAKVVSPLSRGEVLDMDILAAMTDAGVTNPEEGVYVMANSLEIPAEYEFSLNGVKELRLCDGIFLAVDCPLTFDAADGARVKVTRNSETDHPGGIRMYNDSEVRSLFRGIDFEYVQLANSGATGFDVIDCTFTNAGSVLNSTAALSLSSTDAEFAVRGCTFTGCEVPAIGCPANHAIALTIEDCVFADNNTSNTNKPQLNLTVGGNHDLVIRRCTLTGAMRDKVGGIAVGNLTVLPGTNRVYIEGCTITNHRYGLTGVGPMYMEIRDNVLVDNRYETNAMNGGSGISLAGYNYGLDAIISGNEIRGSLWGVTLIMCRDINMGEVDNPASPGGNVFSDNGNGGVLYDLYNNQADDVMAQLNTWGVDEQTAEKIETVIYHKADDSQLGLVTYLPAADGAGIVGVEADGALGIDGGVVSGVAPVKVYRMDGTLAVPAAARVDIRTLSPGVYIATDGTRTVKVVR